jgi:hypothetical protein
MRTADSPGVDVFTSELVRIDLPKLLTHKDNSVYCLEAMGPVIIWILYSFN